MKGNDWATYRRLLSYVRPDWPIFVVAVQGLDDDEVFSGGRRGRGRFFDLQQGIGKRSRVDSE